MLADVQPEIPRWGLRSFPSQSLCPRAVLNRLDATTGSCSHRIWQFSQRREERRQRSVAIVIAVKWWAPASGGVDGIAGLWPGFRTPSCRTSVGFRSSSGRGFYDEVLPVTSAEREMLARLPWNDEAFAASIGLTHLHGEQGYTTVERLWTRPSWRSMASLADSQARAPKR
jgi:hypothetical protein